MISLLQTCDASNLISEQKLMESKVEKATITAPTRPHSHCHYHNRNLTPRTYIKFLNWTKFKSHWKPKHPFFKRTSCQRLMTKLKTQSTKNLTYFIIVSHQPSDNATYHHHLRIEQLLLYPLNGLAQVTIKISHNCCLKR